jgi:hypothetical protein
MMAGRKKIMTYEQSALYEQRFWLQILGDHSRFIYESLAPKETEEIQRAKQFIARFDELLERARQPLAGNELMKLNQTACQQAQQLRAFKLHLLQRHLVGNISMNLSPTFINHMVNELEEYMRVLSFLLSMKVPSLMNPLHHHLLWLLDATGHAAAITSSLDMVEKRLMEKSKTFEKHFGDFYHKAIELAGYLRTHLDRFPSLNRLNHQVELEISLFREFLLELEEMEMNHVTLGTLSPLMADHMAREACYYLTTLSHVSEVHEPQCDATKPRVKE